ncbi:MAG: rhomboid family intramembrane serine protease [Flavobacteriaceae bacterium]
MKFKAKILRLPFLSVFLIWVIFWIEGKSGLDFARFGIYPRDISSLFGILFSPFIHGDLEHLYNNSVPLFVLLLMMQYFYKKQTLWVIFFGVLFSGLFTWIVGRPSYHIGASGLIYVLVSFVFFKGIITKNYRLTALSFIVVFLYGSMIWYIFDIREGMSWEGHLGGFLGGFILAFLTETPEEYIKTYKYEWERPDFNRYKDPFMKHFDENGNFVSNPHVHTTTDEEIKFKYVIVKEEEEKQEQITPTPKSQELK